MRPRSLDSRSCSGAAATAGTVVELIPITDPGTGRDVEKLRINRDGYFLADVRSWDDAAKLGIDIADLRETQH